MNLKYMQSCLLAAYPFIMHANPEQSEAAGAVMEQAGEPSATEGEVLPPEPAKPEMNLPEGASISYAKLGEERAKEIASLDEKVAGVRTTLRQDVLKVLQGPEAAHGTYIAGFTAVMAQREASGKDVRTLRNVKSQVSRVFKAYKANPRQVLETLKDSGKRWDVMLKALPKQSNAGRPSTGAAQPEAGKGGEIPSNLETATDVAEMRNSILAIAERMREVAKGRNQPYAEYVAVEIIDAAHAAHRDFAKVFSEHGGADADKAKLREALKLDRKLSA